MAVILESKAVCKYFGGLKAVNNVDMKVEQGQIFGIIGPNGAGKTTLLKCMMGFLHWNRGDTYIDGQPLGNYGHAELWKSVSYVPQAKHNAFSYSILDTVVMGLNAGSSLFSAPSKADYTRAYSMLERMGIAHLAQQGCNAVSGGQLQMALIARALVSDPKILILDEPESNLDMYNQLKVVEAIERIAADRTCTCIVNTHFPDHALAISDETLFMGRDGQRLLGPSRNVITEANIERFYGVRARVAPVATDLGERRCVVPYALAAV